MGQITKKLNYWAFIILALMIGGLGIHEFYRKNTGAGIVMLLFFWTCIPALIAFITAVVWLCKGEEEFDSKYNDNGTV